MELTAAALWLNTVFAQFDASVTIAIHRLYDLCAAFFTPFFYYLSYFMFEGVTLIILSILMFLCVKTRRVGAAMCIALALESIVVNVFLKVYVARPRPYLEDFYRQLWMLVRQATESDKSFPSGHTTAAFASMVPIFLYYNKRVSWLALFYALLLAVSRIYLCVHYPTDVIAGLLIGVIAGIAGKLIADKLPESFCEYRLAKKKRSS